VWRWHFYAGLLCIPFVLWLAATGSIYLFKPQIDAWLDRPYEDLQVGQVIPPSAQVRAALAAVPGSVLYAYQLPRTPHSAVQVLVGRGDQLTRAYVQPGTAQILHVVSEDKRFTNMLSHLHGELLQGDAGSMVVETAASWTIVMVITGLYLWWPSGAGAAGVLYPRLHRRGRMVWRDLHAVAGFWVSLFVLFLLISGLPWAKSWGGALKEIRHWASEQPVHQDWTTGRSSELAERRLATTPTAAGDEHAAHHHHGGATMASSTNANAYSSLDALVPVVRAQQLVPPVLIAPPSGAAAHWTARSETQNRPRQVKLVLDSTSSAVLSRSTFADRPLLDRVIWTGVAAHEGQLFAPLNQLLGLFTAVSLWLVCISAVVMWWRRRPAGALGAPAASGRSRLAVTLIVLVVVMGLLLPLMGITLLAVWILERTMLCRWDVSREFLGLQHPA
jgi:uncharacterized iron-regulated membrane protein